MGQPNEKEDPLFLLDRINSYEEYLKNQIITFSEKTFTSLKKIIEEYQSYKVILDKYPRRKFGLSPLRKRTEYKPSKRNNELSLDKNQIDDINHKFERVNKWIQMAKTPHYQNNLQLILQKIKGKGKDKTSNKDLTEDNSTKKNDKKENDINNNKKIQKPPLPNNGNQLKKDYSDINIIVKKKKLKKLQSSPDIKMILIGNKADLENKRKVTLEEANKLKEEKKQ